MESIRILYVEDDQDIREVALMALESVGGFCVRACASGREAMSCATDFAPQLLLLDVMMPDMDGPATLRSLRTLPLLSETPAIFMTAKVQPSEVAQFLRLGALDVVAKPFDPMTLSSAIEEIWLRSKSGD